MRNLRYTDVARNDLVEAWLYLANKNQAAADEMLIILAEDAARLALHPQLGRFREDLASGIQSWPS